MCDHPGTLLHRQGHRWIAPLGVSCVMEDIEVWRTAHHCIKRYGNEARSRASKRADTLLAAGDVQEAQLWRRIAEAIANQEQEKPDDSA